MHCGAWGIYFISLKALAFNFTIYEVNYFISTKLIFHSSKNFQKTLDKCFSPCYNKQVLNKWPDGQAVKTPPFHGGIGGSIPPRVTRKRPLLIKVVVFFNEINPFRICEMCSAREIRLWRMKYSLRECGFILLHRKLQFSISQFTK